MSSQIDEPKQSKNIILEVIEKNIDTSKNCVFQNPLYYNKNTENIILKSFDNFDNNNKFLPICKNIHSFFKKYNKNDCKSIVVGKQYNENCENDEDDDNEDDEDYDDEDEENTGEDEYEVDKENENDNEENIVELFNIKIRGREKEYYTDNIVNGSIYEIDELDAIGPKVGKFVNRRVVMNNKLKQ